MSVLLSLIKSAFTQNSELELKIKTKIAIILNDCKQNIL